MFRKQSIACALLLAILLSSCNHPQYHVDRVPEDASNAPSVMDTPASQITATLDTPATAGAKATLSATGVSLPLATPYAQEPAAGICGLAEGEWVTMTIFVDIPDPRCIRVEPGQKLTVINQTQGRISVSLGRFHSDLNPGEEIHLDQPFGTYLAPGVHLLEVDPCCGGTLWLLENNS
jgi:hypothetical protein